VAKKTVGRGHGKAEGSARVPAPLGKRASPKPRRSSAEPSGETVSPTLFQGPPAGEAAPGNSFPIVGIGASAGGLEAFTELLSHLPDDTGMAFVLIQHLDPKHESHLKELLAKATKMAVAEVKGETRAEANHVYVIPPGFNLGISGGVLRTLPRLESGRNMPIDSFLRALAGDRGSQAFGVVLSGTATDGTLGLQEIKAAGGITFAQERRSARFDGMPQSAIAAGAVDFVLPPAGIARQLVALARQLFVTPELQKAIEQPGDAAIELDGVFRLLRNASGVDFTHYKQGTVRRRIRRRMALRGFQRMEDYLQELEQNREEANALCQDFLISVTAFFRELAVFQELREKVFPALVAGRGRENPLRAWVPGCATGEEAYSLAISLTEFLDERRLSVPIQIFATDISERAIQKARAGIYTEAALAHFPPERMTRFFTKSGRCWRVARIIRDACVFAEHNVAQDPPFSNLDLISCCNVLIYLEPVLQRRVLSIFHYALKPAGFLVLGSSESIGTLSELFHQEGKKHNIYRPLPAASRPAPQLSERRGAEGRVDFAERIAGSHFGQDVQREADRLVLAEYGPAGVIVDDDMNIVQVRGHTGPYLELSQGPPGHDVLRMVREGLRGGLSKALRIARQKNAVAQEDGLRIGSTSESREVKIRVIPLRGSSPPRERYFLILFEDKGPAGGPGPGPKPTGARRKAVTHGTEEVARLRSELSTTSEDLQSIITAKETAIEELMSANEEAQALNEELETAKEELQSANEELNTLNDEMRERNAELSRVNRDLAALLETISIPLVMVGRDLRIRRFTQAIEPMLNLIASDTGRSITDLQPQIELLDLRRLLLDAIEGRDPKPRDIRDSNRCWYSLRILPSVGPDGKIDGAVMMMIDIDAAKRGLDFAEAVIETMRQPLVILNKDLRVARANKAFYDTFQAARKETEGRLIYDLGDGQWNIPSLRELLQDILAVNSSFRDFEVTHEFERVGRKVMLLNACEVFDPNTKAPSIVLAIEDTTDRRRAENALKATNAELQDFAYALTHDLQEPLRMVVNFTQLLAQEHEGKLSGDADRYIAYSVAGARRMEALLKALLNYWEVTERAEERLAPVDCNDVLAKTLLNLQTAIVQSGAIVTSDPLPTLLAEEVMLTQLFQNLIANSIKYRGEEMPRIHVSAERKAGGWLFSVRDNGVGIDPQYAEHVFGMFRRLHGPDIPGTGIGLALCRKIVGRHGGRIWVESEKGHGAALRFLIAARHNGP
jgi:two-component system, chemotaxis family, CheB/CheR fusion protein